MVFWMKWDVWESLGHLGFVIKFKQCVLYFFFFFEFRPESAVSPNTALVGVIQYESPWVRAASAQVKKKKKTHGRMRPDKALTRGQRRPSHVSVLCHVRRGCGSSGATSMLPRLYLFLTGTSTFWINGRCLQYISIMAKRC